MGVPTSGSNHGIYTVDAVMGFASGQAVSCFAVCIGCTVRSCPKRYVGVYV